MDSADVAKMVGAKANTHGDFAIASQKVERAKGEFPPPKPPKKPPPEIPHEQRIVQTDRGPLAYLGCYRNSEGRDLKWGPNKTPFDIKGCGYACPEYKYFALADGVCTCDNMYGFKRSGAKTQFPKIADGECDVGRNSCGKGCGTEHANAIYTMKPAPDEMPCPDVRRRRRYLTDKPGQPGTMKMATAQWEGVTEFKAPIEGGSQDYEGAFHCVTGKEGDMKSGGKFSLDQCKALCHQFEFCTQIVWSCTKGKSPTTCTCKLFRTPGKKQECSNLCLPGVNEDEDKQTKKLYEADMHREMAPCQRFTVFNRFPTTAPKIPLGPPPPPQVLPKHCNGDDNTTSAKPTMANLVAVSAAQAAVEESEETNKPPTETYKAGSYPEEKVVVKYNHATFNMENGVAGCQIGTAHGRRKLEVSVEKLGQLMLGDINFTFMRMTVCKGNICESQKQILECNIQYKTPNLEDPSQPPVLEASEACDDPALSAALTAI